ncbi:MAG: GNAT family N-acetyltransferase [Bernardetiaceae bacterium]|nr:GNAT family N-acetyltransferase [Bernardetiaceae bacterium]
MTFFCIDNEEDMQKAFAIRRKVFVEEQQVSEAEEYDKFESHARHFLLLDAQSQPIGTARWRFSEYGIKLERFAILKEKRARGYGMQLLDGVIADIQAVAQEKRIKGTMYLHAQVSAVPFYKKRQFATQGDVFEECNIKHYKMKRQIFEV